MARKKSKGSGGRGSKKKRRLRQGSASRQGSAQDGLGGTAQGSEARIERGRVLTPVEVKRRKIETSTAGLSDEPVVVGLAGPRPHREMRFEMQRYVSGIGWSHEAYARTKEEANVIGRQRVGVFGHRWRVHPLLGASQSTGVSPGKPGRKKTKKKKEKKATQARVKGSRAKVRKEVTDYNRSAPTLRKPAKEDPNRTEEEVVFGHGDRKHLRCPWSSPARSPRIPPSRCARRLAGAVW
ncbi:hypothetical protein OAF82_00050 [bacterium]|nr:hypothetical protein [bacterium]